MLFRRQIMNRRGTDNPRSFSLLCAQTRGCALPAYILRRSAKLSRIIRTAAQQNPNICWYRSGGASSHLIKADVLAITLRSVPHSARQRQLQSWQTDASREPAYRNERYSFSSLARANGSRVLQVLVMEHLRPADADSCDVSINNMCCWGDITCVSGS